jgi:enamine deaminase RidA (YjgF/YER057c/UK114 family)
MSAEQRIRDLGITLPEPPRPLGAYVETVQTARLLYLSGILPVEQGALKYIGRIGNEVGFDDARRAAHLATLNVLSAARAHLGSLDRVTRVVRTAVSLVTTPDFRDHAKVGDGTSELLAAVFGTEKLSTRMIYGLASLPAGACLAVEVILEVAE